MNKTHNDQLLHDAEMKMGNGEFKKAYELIEPLLAEGNPTALFLYSHFSLSGTEREEEFEKRSIEMLKTAAETGFAPAVYSLAVCYELGDRIAMSKVRAADLFKQAAEAGYTKAKVSHGLNTYYGSYGVPKDAVLGLELIREAASEGCDEASEALRDLDPQQQE